MVILLTMKEGKIEIIVISQSLIYNLTLHFYLQGNLFAALGTRSYSSVSEATFQTKPYKLHKLDSGPSTDVTVTRDDALKYYREMMTIRRMEAAANSLYKEKIVRGFCHLYSGQVSLTFNVLIYLFKTAFYRQMII